MILFLTSDDGVNYAELTAKTKSDYAQAHGYEFERIDLNQFMLHGANVYWAQVLAMQSAFEKLNENDWLNYTGADSFIVPGASPCDGLLDEEFDLIISQDKNGLNNNGFFLKKSEWSSEFLKRVWETRSHITNRQAQTIPVRGELCAQRENNWPHEWCEQAGFILALRGHLDHVMFVPQKVLNAYPSELYPECEDGNFIVHLPGLSDSVRMEYLERVLA